jgi:serine/threonine protein phosphatase PrpC
MAASSLVNSAKEHGGRDNITVIIVAIDPSAVLS